MTAIRTVCETLGDDELRVIAAIAGRLKMGARHYGALSIQNDPRDWRQEASEEALDQAVYAACELLRPPSVNPRSLASLVNAIALALDDIESKLSPTARRNLMYAMAAALPVRAS